MLHRLIEGTLAAVPEIAIAFCNTVHGLSTLRRTSETGTKGTLHTQPDEPGPSHRDHTRTGVVERC